ncbi:MAG TPA: signal recognition particle-docking protein FtsY [Roseomonas sp.]|nr:signal recognition particle-docking protein FtsY [Roseomonas sp.]
MLKGLFNRFRGREDAAQEPRPPELPIPGPPEAPPPGPETPEPGPAETPPSIPEPMPEPAPVEIPPPMGAVDPVVPPMATVHSEAAPAPVAPVISPPAEPVPAEPEAPPMAAEPPAKGGWFSRLKAGLARSTAKLTDSVTALFTKRKLDDAALEELEETLIAADLGVAASQRIVEGFRKTRFGKEVTDEEVKATLAEEIASILTPVAAQLVIEPARAPHVVLVVGVNGTGKTTTIAKLGKQYRDQGLRTGFVAGDTFRAAAVEQLQVWADRTGARFFPPAKPGADAAGLAFDALATARAEGLDVLLVDTAGRLHNKSALMEELRKVIRVIRRVDETAPHSVLLVLDATTGQNAVQQVKVFKEMVDVSGLAVTKLDGSAKGGVVVALAQEFGLPVHVVGVGEKAEDLRPFEARDFARGLLGLD